MTLFEIDSEFANYMDAILEVFDEETGEVTDVERYEEIQAKLDTLNREREQKISNVACWYKSLVAEAEAVKTEKNNLARRQQLLERKAESLKKYLSYALNGEKFSDARVNISYRTSKTVEFMDGFDYSKLPTEFQKITIEPKKAELKKAIEGGEGFAGVWLKDKKNIQIK